MKKYLLVILGCAMIGLSLTGQEETTSDHFEYANVLRLSPIDFGRSYFEVTYQRYFNDRSHSLLISPTFMLKESSFESFTGLQLMMNYRFHLTHLKKGQNRTMGMYNIDFYAGPYLAGTVYSEDFRFGYYDDQSQTFVENDYNKDINAAETGLILGVQFDITPRIVIDFYGGGGIRFASESTDLPEEFMDMYYSGDGVFDIDYTGVKPKLGLQIGFTF